MFVVMYMGTFQGTEHPRAFEPQPAEPELQDRVHGYVHGYISGY